MSIAAGGLGLVGVLAVGAGVLGRGYGNAAPTPPPIATPAPASTPGASPEPSERPLPVDGNEFTIQVGNLDGADLDLYVRDDTGHLTDVTSERPGDAMSVRWYEMRIVNVDDHTLRVTWVGFPKSDDIALVVEREQGGLTLRMFQDAPPPNSDGQGYDRSIFLTFDEPVSADEVDGSVRRHRDTEG
jgi:hypothetical protein